MRHFRKDLNVRGAENQGIIDQLIIDGWAEMTAVEFEEFRNPTQLIGDAQTLKYTEIWSAAETRIDAQTNDGSKNPNQYKRLQAKSQKRLMKMAGGRPLTVQDQADEDWFDNFFDWADLVRDKADISCDEVELLATPEAVIAYDVTAIIWPTYTP